MQTNYSNKEACRAVLFARRHRETDPIASPIFRNFSPSELQHYSALIGLDFSTKRSLIYRNLYVELFPRMFPAGQIQLDGLNVYLIGKDLRTLHTRTFFPDTPEARLGTPMTLGIVIRDNVGKWPPREEDLEKAIQASGASKEEVERAMPLRNHSSRDPHFLCCALLSLLIAGNEEGWVMVSYDITAPAYRLIWLDGSVEVHLDLSAVRKVWTRSPKASGSEIACATAASLLLDGEPGSFSAPVICLKHDFPKIVDITPTPPSPVEDHDGSRVEISEDGLYLSSKYVSFDMQATGLAT
ncbi:hypothetical protein K469DRAFT_686692 [Zopfia rhizophila CBS 207.26]|uniref:Uncharacterized protein n=1 Tax=Zopfia rhizophila CBS 207.26 TaxID=1314779 RepID=A0A6A6ET15_9PEZI|nr:hypothetical protein K469DRAFT_686692 [Zopfia rhizophila CBS 207.26]